MEGIVFFVVLRDAKKYPKYGVGFKGGLDVDPKRTLRANLR